MGVRNESVRLSLDDQFTSGMARAAAATAVLRKELKGLDGTNVNASKGLKDTDQAIKDVDNSTRNSASNIDKYSGRLGLLADAAITLGPALVPLGASTIPILTASMAGLGATAAGVGTAVLAFKGLGDAFKAVSAYDIAPTVENLQKLRIEQEKIGPAGAQFVKYITDLEPHLRSLQGLARGGIFPGFEDGINDLLTRLPQMRRVVIDMSNGMGELAREAGHALASDKWTPFFHYVRTDATPIFEAFARSTGNVVETFANLLVAFAPLTRNFTGGMEAMTQSLAEWSRGLGDNESFTSFLTYLQDTGPRVLDLLGSLAKTFASIVEAAAPIGAAILPVLTDLSNIIGAIADSDLGTPLLGALIAFRLYTRGMQGITAISTSTFGKIITGQKEVTLGFGKAGAAARTFGTDLNNVARYGTLATESSGRLKGQLATFGKSAALVGGLALATSDLSDKFALNNTTSMAMLGIIGGPWGVAIGAGVGLAEDFAQANNQLADAIERANLAMSTGNVDDEKKALADLKAGVDATNKALDQNTFKQAFKLLTGNKSEWNAGANVLSGAYADAIKKQAELARSMHLSRAAANLLAPSIGRTAQQLYDASGAAKQFSDALANLNGWFDKREALRGYRDDIAKLSKGLKDGFGAKDVDNLDAAGRAIIQVASQIKSVDVRNDFLAGARKSLTDLANNAGPKAQKSIQQVIDKLDQFGLTKPPTPKLKADGSDLNKKVNGAQALLDELVGRPYKAKITADGGQAILTARQVAAALSNLHDRTVFIRVHTVHDGGDAGLADQHGGSGYASGGYTGRGGKYEVAGVVHREELVLPREIVKRDLQYLKARYSGLPGFAGGGLVGSARTTPTGGSSDAIYQLGHFTDAFSGSLKEAKRKLDEVNKAYDKQKAVLDAIRSKMADLASTLAGRFPVDLSNTGSAQGASMADLQAQGLDSATAYAVAQASTSSSNPLTAIADATAKDNQLLAIIRQLKKWGLSGPALAQMIAQTPLEGLQALISAGPGAALAEQSALNGLYAAQAGLGHAGAQAAYGAQENAAAKATRALHQQVVSLEATIKQQTAELKKASAETGPDRTAQGVVTALNGVATRSHK